MEKEIYLIYDADDIDLVNDIRKKIENIRDDIFFLEVASKPIFSLESSMSIRENIRKMMGAVDMVLCMIGYSTNMNKWVNWEVNTASYLEKKIIGVRLHDIYMDQIPKALQGNHTKIISCDTKSILNVIGK